MSLNGLVHPFPEKYQSLNWSWVTGNQLTPQGLGPVMNQCMRYDYGQVAPYTNPDTVRAIEATTPFRVWGYPNVTQCGRLAPLLYYRRQDPNPQKKCCGGQSTDRNTGCPVGKPCGQCSCGSDNPAWPYTWK